MKIKSEEQNGIKIFKLYGDIDISTSPDVKKSFDKALSRDNNKVIINLENVGYVDSSGLATLVEIYKSLRVHTGKLKLTNLSDKVKGLFEITKLDKLFDIVPSEEEAINGFNT
jgi:anti-sigma B factor antagonist